MAAFKLSVLFALALAPNSAWASKAQAEVFPSLRKRKQQQAAIKADIHEMTTVQDETDETEGPSLPKQHEDSDAAVPGPMDAAKSKFPQLPAIAQILSGASGTVKQVNSQASVLEAHVVKAQMQIETRMAKQKAAFEEKLKDQEKANRLVIEANNNISTEIQNLKHGNADLKKSSEDVQKASHLMRSQLRLLQSRLGVAEDFCEKSLASTDDSKNTLLQILSNNQNVIHLVQTSKDAQEDDDEDDDDSTDNYNATDDKDDDESDNDSRKTSFLSLAVTAHRSHKALASMDIDVSLDPGVSVDAAAVSPDITTAANTGDLLETLSHEVTQLAQQEKDSQKKLKDLFIQDFRAGAKRKAALLQQQKGLIATRTSLEALQGRLKSAVAHLQATQKHLESRLHGLGHYLQKLAHLAMAPPKDAPHLLQELPKAVAIKES